MSYNQKPAGTGSSGMGGAGPPNGPNNPQQVAKTLAGIQQQMQNFVHAQNALPQSSQADFNTIIQQQRFQNMLKQQQQHLLHQHFQQQMQQQQQQHQQQQQQQNKDRVGTEPLALTRTPAAADLLNKTYQQHHQQHPNGNPNAPNSAAAAAALNPFQQQLQVIPPNIVQQLQAFQLQMQQAQQQQQQQQQQHHSQTQQSQHHTPPPGPLQTLPQQQLHGQSAQQQKTALSTVAAVAQLQQRYLSAAVAQTAAAQATSGNKVVATPPPLPPPLTTNQIKPPNLPPSTQITPVPANSGGSQSTVKPTIANTAASVTVTTSPVKQVSPSISLLPSKTSATPLSSTPVAAHQQNKFIANKNSTPVTSAAATPIPAHVQKLTTSATPSSGIVPLISSAEISTKPNSNTDTTLAPVVATKLPQKSVGSHAKVTAPSASLPTNATNTIATAKAQSSHGAAATTKQTTTNFHSQLPPPKSLQSVAKPTEAQVESVAQTDTESAQSQSTVGKPTVAAQEAKKLLTVNEVEKSDSSVTVDKIATSKESRSTVTESPVKNSSPKAPITIVEKGVKAAETSQAKEMTKIDQVPVKANNNNVSEKGKSNEKEDTSTVVAQNKVNETNKKPAKETNEEKAKHTLTKKAETTTTIAITESSTKDEVAPNVDQDTSKSTKSALDKKPQNTVTSKKANEESNLSTGNQNKSEDNKICNEQVQENKEQKSNLKDRDNSKEDDAKPTKVEKQEEIVATSESASTPPASSVKVKLSREIETVGSSESMPLKKPSRQPKSNKVATASVAMIATTSDADKTPEVAEKIEKPEKAEKPSSSRTSREEKRKIQKTSPVDTATPTLTTPTTPRDASNSGNDRKSLRHRLKTILYQSPLPELAYITKLSASEASNSPKPMSGEDKLIVFYKNEYMAVRNAEGTFYLCQTMQNVYRTSPRISIRWLSEDAKDNSVFIPDFYDHTDIECVLTTVELKRIDKGHLRLPETEKGRIENILKKAIDVEKGLVPRPELTEENPDGLDISLYKDESQIEKKLSGIQTPVSTVRNSRRSINVSAAKSVSKTNTPLKAGSNKRKASTTGGIGGSAAKKSKSPAKKRKPPTKRKTTRGTTSDEENETSEDHASDAEYKPSQKKSNVNTATKSSPRVQRSPLAKARVASPVASTSASARNKNAASKVSASTSIPSRSERATKRKAGVEAVRDSPVPSAKKTTTASNVNNADSTSVTHATKSSITKVKESLNNDATSSSKKITTETGGILVSASGSAPNTAQAESENATANGNTSNSSAAAVAAASRPTRSRK